MGNMNMIMEAVKVTQFVPKLYTVNGVSFRIGVLKVMPGLPFSVFVSDVDYFDKIHCGGILVALSDIKTYMKDHSDESTKEFLRMVVGHEIGHLVDFSKNFKAGFNYSVDREAEADAWAILHCGGIDSYHRMMATVISTIKDSTDKIASASLSMACGAINNFNFNRRMRLAAKKASRKEEHYYSDIDEIVDMLIEAAKREPY